MEMLSLNNVNKQNFSLFIRDLSQTLNSNLKHIIEDTFKDENKVNNKKHYNKKKPVIEKSRYYS